MMGRAWLGTLLALAAAASVPAADVPRLVHGADAVFSGEGVVIIWGVLRGADEGATHVVVRLVGTAPTPRAVSVEAIDPFTQRRAPIAGPAEFSGALEIRIPRRRFADYPRTELHFAARPDDLLARAPALTIYYTGVPDTTPEFVTADALSAYFERALAGRGLTRP